MALDYTKPSEPLAVELNEVKLDASELTEYLANLNIPLPAEFPTAELRGIAETLIDLPDGTARGCREPLVFAQEKLAALRGAHIRRDDDASERIQDTDTPLPLRREPLDDKVTALMSSVSTALQVANRLYTMEPEVPGLPDPNVAPPDSAPIERISATVQDGERALRQHRKELDDIRVPESENADLLRRRLTDAVALNRIARSELAMPRIVPAWLKKMGIITLR